MGNEKMKVGMIINLTGAVIAYLIGSGAASGQESMQYYSGWGSVGASVVVALSAFLLIYFTYISYSYAGRTRGLEDIRGVFNFYAGGFFGKVFEFAAWMFNACCYVFMISGFGNVLNQQWGLPIAVGSAIAVVVSVGTAICGLSRIVDVIGKIGPVIIVFILIIGIVSAFKYFPMIAEGNAAINSGEVEVMRAGANPLLAGLSFGGCSLLLVAAFVGRMGNDLRQYQFKYNRIILFGGVFSIIVVSFVMGLNHIGNIQNSATAPIPNLLLANELFQGNAVAGAILGGVFAVIILAAIYSTICPMVWTCVSTFIPDEKSAKYKLASIVGGVVIYIVTLFVPYEVLLNYIMTYCGYFGMIVGLVCIVRYVMVRMKDKETNQA